MGLLTKKVIKGADEGKGWESLVLLIFKFPLQQHIFKKASILST